LSWRFERFPLSGDAWASALYRTDKHLYIWGTSQRLHVTTLARIALSDVISDRWDQVQAYLTDEPGQPQFVTKPLGMFSSLSLFIYCFVFPSRFLLLFFLNF
jgi:hypothetical protein